MGKLEEQEQIAFNITIQQFSNIINVTVRHERHQKFSNNFITSIDTNNGISSSINGNNKAITIEHHHIEQLYTFPNKNSIGRNINT